jgi:FG-GAP-like repeat
MHQLSFQTSAAIPTGTGPLSVILVDLNGDNKLDLVSANSTASSISVNFGNGTGGFGSRADYTAALNNRPTAIAAGDFDRDGAIDLFVTNFESDTVSVLRNTGAGVFSLRSTFSLSANSRPTDIVVGNFNGDANLDFAVVNSIGATVSVAVGDGNGTFALNNVIQTLASPVSLAVGRFNADTIDDLVVANLLAPDGETSKITIALGAATGPFVLPPSVSLGLNFKPNSVATGDFNKDGKIDFVSANEGNNTISVAFGDGAGGFTVAAPIAVGDKPGFVKVGDYNADGNLDIATANFTGNDLSIALGNGLGSFTHNTTLTIPGRPAGSGPTGLATGDLNGDGKLDFVTANQTTNSATALLSAPERSTIYWRSDVDKTGVIWNQDKPNQLVDARYLTYGKGIGDTRVGTRVLYDPAIWRLVDTVDMNGDGVKDIIYTRDATATQAGEIRVLTIGQFNGQASTVEADREFTFGAAFGAALNGQVAKQGPSWVLAGVADMNGDGQGDLVFYNRPDDRTVIWTTNKSGGLSVGLSVTSDGPFSVANGYQPTGDRNAWNVQALGDFTGDGKTDILWRRDTQEVVLWELDGTVIKSGPTGKSAQLQNLGLNFKVRGVGDFNGDGIKDVLWRDQTGNVSRIWTFGANGKPTESTLLAATDNRWQIDGVADMNQDGTTDVIWRNNNTNTLVIFGIRDAAFSPIGSGEVLNYFTGGNRLAISPGLDYKIDKVTGFGAPGPIPLINPGVV